MNEIYDIPESVEQLFSNGERSYKIIDHSAAMDNIQSMSHFLDCIGATKENIESNDGTQVILRHMDYPGLMVVDAGGLGDFFSHVFVVTEYNFG